MGAVFCWIREWRGSLIGPMTAHALNNTVVVTLGALLLS
jgi:membrane protease YdiL (CAAX protease family)